VNDGNASACVALGRAATISPPKFPYNLSFRDRDAVIRLFSCKACPRPIPGNRKVLDTVHCSFLNPDAKIGVLGFNVFRQIEFACESCRPLQGNKPAKHWVRRGWARRLPRTGTAARPLQDRPRERDAGRCKQKAILDRSMTSRSIIPRKPSDEYKLPDEIEAAACGISTASLSGDGRVRCPPVLFRCDKLSGASAPCPRFVIAARPTSDLFLPWMIRPTIATPNSVSGWRGHLRNYPGAILIVTHDPLLPRQRTGWILDSTAAKAFPTLRGQFIRPGCEKQKRLSRRAQEAAHQRKTLALRAGCIAALAKRPPAKSSA